MSSNRLSHTTKSLFLLTRGSQNKERTVLSVDAPLFNWQSTFYRRVLLSSLERSDYSHGSCPDRSIKTNAEAHLGAKFVYKADISNFYPSVHDRRVYRLFREQFGCSPDVSDLCCRLCTFNHHLALGLSTSPILADQLLRPIDARISAACHKAGWTYTRYVDDITVSSDHELPRSGIESIVRSILREHGFKLKRAKSELVEVSEAVITGVRIAKGRLDVANEYTAELDRHLSDALSLTHDRSFEGPYFTYGQLVGRVRFVSWVNPRRAKSLNDRLRKLSARKMTKHAKERGLVACKKKLVRK